jgi:ATP synthase I chain
VGAALTQGSVMGWNLALGGVACALAAALVSPHFAAALALGAALEAANFRSLFRSCERIVRAGGPGAGPAVALFGVRFLLLGAVIFLALRAGVHPVGLLIGLSLVVPATVVAAWGGGGGMGVPPPPSPPPHPRPPPPRPSPPTTRRGTSGTPGSPGSTRLPTRRRSRP